ncbi:hypothetical protein BC834DRAFT_843423 [Gloeopeniophorella convolvens]|nr:hypothetical protein BC834DRAFT_843423 [Gloeopeniophorella convolvens]
MSALSPSKCTGWMRKFEVPVRRANTNSRDRQPLLGTAFDVVAAERGESGPSIVSASFEEKDGQSKADLWVDIPEKVVYLSMVDGDQLTQLVGVLGHEDDSNPKGTRVLHEVKSEPMTPPAPENNHTLIISYTPVELRRVIPLKQVAGLVNKKIRLLNRLQGRALAKGASNSFSKETIGHLNGTVSRGTSRSKPVEVIVQPFEVNRDSSRIVLSKAN